MERPVELLPHGVDKNGIARFGKLVHAFCPERHGKANEQDGFNQDDGEFQVSGNAAGDAFVIGYGMPATMITKENIKKKNRPTDEERSHEPMAKLQDVIDLVAVLGTVWRLPEEFVDQSEPTHTATNPLRPAGRTVPSANENAARGENRMRRFRPEPT